ncbi:hypothetical protein LZ30DRAFT_775908 [Colletotrichum cereale]|nr:hypothetical protein LZ30DRAFT_775908 [Colletotrichum cereale]
MKDGARGWSPSSSLGASLVGLSSQCTSSRSSCPCVLVQPHYLELLEKRKDLQMDQPSAALPYSEPLRYCERSRPMSSLMPQLCEWSRRACFVLSDVHWSLTVRTCGSSPPSVTGTCGRLLQTFAGYLISTLMVFGCPIRAQQSRPLANSETLGESGSDDQPS